MKNSQTFLVLFILAVSAFGQQQISPEMIQKYQQQYGDKVPFASSERMQQLLSDYQKQKIDEAATQKKEDDEEPGVGRASFADTAGRIPKPSAGASMYENLLRGINVHPDSQLSSLTMFGYDVFSKTKPSTFAPTDAASVPADYQINSGDEIVVMLWGRINEEYRLKVTRDGTINLPRIGPVPVAGLSFETMQKNILDKVNAIEGVHATISMGSMRSIGIYIVGEVSSPGFYTVSALTNVTNALFAAGGPTKRGSLRNIQFKRSGRTIATIDFYDFLLSGSDRSGLRLQAGDVIHVPIVESMVAVAGNVRRSALYELKGKTSLAQAIELAGGLAPTAWSNRIQVERFMNYQFQSVLDIGSESGKIPSFQIMDGDIIKVFPVLEKDKNAVYLSGNVLRPGKYEFKEGMRISDLLSGYSSLLPETYFDYGIIMRQDSVSFLDRIYPFNLKNVLESYVSADNMLLRPKDEVVVYNKDFFEPDRTVSIGGSVTTPGVYKLLENMKLRDLILQAGGLREDASPSRGELYRRTMKGNLVETEKIEFCVECAMKDAERDNHLLLRSDRVFVRPKMGWERERKVTLLGQFTYPGTYVIFERESLGDLIKRAGGFKDDAYLAASVFTRASVKRLEAQRKTEYLQQLEQNILALSSELAAKEQSQAAQAVLAQQMALKESLQKIVPAGRVIIDLTKPENYDRFLLEDGDTIAVPRNMNTVSVVGEVFNPATFTFNLGKASPLFYIESAGGLKESADKKHIYVVKANGSIITGKMQSLSSISLQPGDAVVVPQRVRYTSAHRVFVDTMDAVFKMATILVLVATLVSSMNR